jgi:hypothetical protein
MVRIEAIATGEALRVDDYVGVESKAGTPEDRTIEAVTVVATWKTPAICSSSFALPCCAVALLKSAGHDSPLRYQGPSVRR